MSSIRSTRPSLGHSTLLVIYRRAVSCETVCCCPPLGWLPRGLGSAVIVVLFLFGVANYSGKVSTKVVSTPCGSVAVLSFAINETDSWRRHFPGFVHSSRFRLATADFHPAFQLDFIMFSSHGLMPLTSCLF